MRLEDVLPIIYLVSAQTKTDIYVVGGFVRDELLKKAFKKDVDFVVLGSGLEFAKALDVEMEEAGSLVEFPDFDTARYVFVDREDNNRVLLELEFAGARTEVYDETSRKPVVTATSLEEDLKRRDFTINAMARKVEADGISKDIVDLFDGQTDLERGVLKTPLDPNETFSEDPLRMLRAARFAAQLEFAIDGETLSAMARNKDRLAIISKERISEELFKLLKAKQPSIGFVLLFQTGLLEIFLPEVVALAGVEEVAGYTHKDNFSHTLAVLDNIAEYSDDVLLRFAGLMHDIAKPQTKEFEQGRGWTFDMHEHLGKKITWEIGKRLRMKKSDIYYVAELVRWHLQPIALMDKGVTDSAVRRLIVNLEDKLPDLLVLCRADITTGNQKKKVRRLKNYDYLEKRIEEVLEKDQLRAFQSPVRGEEIMGLCGLKPGPTVGKIKEEIERAILDGEISNEYEPARAYFDTIKDTYLEGALDWEKDT
ncbi:CCA tRNA nucleotidyltransferase [Patescibacteria group bacterium]|nr:CCA tRNA nucleotidyltransferase [Patescibacteria group bacterium]MBU1721480.1 CCA tRNA nucleotidyltransferase [Patescibacteria group bacterium]MBU1900753.1 CCA tRNA nucleotidyltransferase [Patescibacteria group bacterium]